MAQTCALSLLNSKQRIYGFDVSLHQVRQITYPDHYIYTENDLLALAETANKTKSILVSTKKDNVRIPKTYRSLVNILEGEIFFENKDFLIEILTNVIENFIEVK